MSVILEETLRKQLRERMRANFRPVKEPEPTSPHYGDDPELAILYTSIRSLAGAAAYEQDKELRLEMLAKLRDDADRLLSLELEAHPESPADVAEPNALAAV